MIKYKDATVRLYTDIGPEKANKVMEELRFFNEFIDGFFQSYGISQKKANPIRCRLYASTEEFNDMVRKANLSFKAGAFFSLNDNNIIAPYRDGDPVAFVALRHECAHQIIARYFNDPPPWIDEGLATYFGGIEFDPHNDVISCCSPFSHFKAMQTLIAKRKWMDWERLFGFEDRSVWDDEIRRGALNVHDFYTQSWGVVFFYLHSKDEETRNRFAQFMKGMNTGRERSRFIAEDFPKRQKAFESFFEKGHQKISKLFENATQLYGQENYSQCLSLLRAILAEEPMHYASVRLSAEASWQIGEYDLSLEFWRMLAARDPREVLFQWKICRCLVETGSKRNEAARLEEALKVGKASVKLSNNKNPHCLAALAMAHFALGHVREALGVIRNAIRFRCDALEHYKSLEKKYSEALLRGGLDQKEEVDSRSIR